MIPVFLHHKLPLPFKVGKVKIIGCKNEVFHLTVLPLHLGNFGPFGPCSHDTSLAADCQQRNQDFLLWYNGFSDKTTKPTEGETLSVLGKNKKSLKPKFQDFLVRTTGLEPVTSCV